MGRSLVRQECGACRWSVIAAGAIIAGALAGLLIWWFAHVPMSACEKEIRFGDRRHGVKTCLQSYEERKAAATLEKGLIVVFTGTGKGKSTAAFGMLWFPAQG